MSAFARARIRCRVLHSRRFSIGLVLLSAYVHACGHNGHKEAKKVIVGVMAHGTIEPSETTPGASTMLLHVEAVDPLLTMLPSWLRTWTIKVRCMIDGRKVAPSLCIWGSVQW